MQEKTQVFATKIEESTPDYLNFNNSNQCLMSDNLHYYGVSGVQSVASKLAPLLFEKIKLFKEDQVHTISEILDQETEIPTDFLDILGMIALFKGTNLTEHLDFENIKALEDECEGERLCRLYKEDPEKFNKLVRRLETTVNLENLSYVVCALTHQPVLEKDFFNSKKVRDLLFEECSAYFHESGCTDFCHVSVFKTGTREGIRISHGSQPVELGVLENKKRVTRKNNIEKVDSIFFDVGTGTLWINVRSRKSADIKFYKNLITKILTGNGTMYRDLELDFLIVKAPDLRTVLHKRRDYAEKILLRETPYLPDIDSPDSSPLKAGRGRMACITDKSKFASRAQEIPVFTGVVFKVIISEENNIHDSLKIKSGKIFLGGVLKIEDVIDLMTELKIIKAINEN